MIPAIGSFVLIIALGISFVQIFTPFCKNKEIDAKYISLSVFLLVASSFGCLLYSYVNSDFSVLNVYKNSHTHKPLIYKITGTWGNHEGSMLLLCLILAAYCFFFTLLNKLETKMKDIIISVQSAVNVGFLAFIYFTSNPFERIFPKPQNGIGLNPLLQDIGLAMHPPVLYLGYIGFSLGLSYSVAALILGKADRGWATSLKKWTLFSWSCLTLGIGLGSWWAYRELGWGGFWFWDPVENASLMPWLAATALLHSLIVLEKRESLKVWTVLLGVFTFALSLVGIFLVRSGVLTSVHSFASDPQRGTYILIFLGLVVGISLTLFAIKAHKLKPKNKFAPFSKEGGILINNLILVVLCLTVFLGTIYPIIVEVFSENSVAVGVPYFNSVFNPIALPLLVLAGIVPILKWKKDNAEKVKTKLLVPLICALFIFGLVLFVPDTQSFMAAISLSFSTWLISSMLYSLYERRKSSIPIPFLGMVISHIGLGVLAAGITVVSIWGQEQEKILYANESIKIAYYDVKLVDMYIAAKDNYMMRFGNFDVTDYTGKKVATLHPEVRFYPVQGSNTTESDIYYSLLSNLYIAMGDSNDKGGFVVRVYHKPWINLIWLGCVLMAVGGFVAMIKRKK
ncbi:MAG: heme lyase CcmF/NrfE family subunit [Rickettsiales bacterium]|nr:heme lyase CcmF/NrfE family subunit [Pseudomonadota bacterium]MDA0967385.1 heme lyase CcmF/NrfE family subunit [Pseudomonadota bacterium]MDG4544408.1 heme lyase CcmF/NrfE family subunit [Rickettsiales bacterium]MDG4546538.1 heme lyase CcmF/NrfE family subunit [Rickettsiales bacterium]MDG4548684.1 heme lyase CcmF/NrfE family subunit [Rickettsiales bacterium]